MFTRTAPAKLIGPPLLTSDYDNSQEVLRFIKLNKVIPAKLSFYKSSPDDLMNIDDLAQALQQGHLEHAIFSHPECQCYLLFLYEAKRISPDDFLTASIYLHTLMQFSEKQPIKEEDRVTRRLCDIHIYHINDVIHSLLAAFADTHPKKKAPDSMKDDIINQIEQLNPLNKKIIGIDFRNPGKGNDPLYDLMNEYTHASAHLFYHNDIFCVVSAGIVNILLSFIEPTLAIRPAPIFGAIGLESLYRMHQDGRHPVNLSSPLVKSGITVAHDLHMGPLLILLHDYCAHLVWGNVLNKSCFQFVFRYLLPKMGEVLHITFDDITNRESHQNYILLQQIYNVLDLDLTIDDKNSSYELIHFNKILMMTMLIEPKKREILFDCFQHDKVFIADTFDIDVDAMMRNFEEHLSLNVSYHEDISASKRKLSLQTR